MALKYLYVPSGYKAGKTYGVLPNEANADLAFVRGSSATRINADGLVETMGANVPRLDYTDGSCPTLLTEPTSTNLVEYSEDFSQWDKINGGTGIVPVVSTGFSAPDGSSNARKVVLNKGAGTTLDDRSYLEVAYTSSASTYTQTVWARVESGTSEVLVDFDSSSSNVVTLTTDWQRITNIKTVASVGSRTARVGLRGSTGTDDAATVLVWGAQLEEQPNATSYISTSGATATRAADTGVVSGDLSSYINSSEGVLEIRAKSIVNNPTTDLRITLSDGTANNRISLVWGTGSSTMNIAMNASGSDVFDGGTSGVKSLTGSFNKTNMNTFKIKWKSGDIQVKHNDSTIVLSETDTFTMLGIDTLSFDNATGIRNFEGDVQYIKVYDSITDF
jgi:hypothetical protein